MKRFFLLFVVFLSLGAEPKKTLTIDEVGIWLRANEQLILREMNPLARSDMKEKLDADFKANVLGKEVEGIAIFHGIRESDDHLLTISLCVYDTNKMGYVMSGSPKEQVDPLLRKLKVNSTVYYKAKVSGKRTLEDIELFVEIPKVKK